MKHVSEVTIEELNQALKEVADRARKESIETGVPVTYLDENGNIVREHPDGRIDVLKEKNDE